MISAPDRIKTMQEIRWFHQNYSEWDKKHENHTSICFFPKLTIFSFFKLYFDLKFKKTQFRDLGAGRLENGGGLYGKLPINRLAAHIDP